MVDYKDPGGLGGPEAWEVLKVCGVVLTEMQNYSNFCCLLLFFYFFGPREHVSKNLVPA